MNRNILNTRSRMWAQELLGGTCYPYSAVPGLILPDEWRLNSMVYRLGQGWKPPKNGQN